MSRRVFLGLCLLLAWFGRDGARAQTTTTPDELRVRSITAAPADIRLFGSLNGQFYLARLVGFTASVVNGELVITAPSAPAAKVEINRLPTERQFNGAWTGRSAIIIDRTKFLVYRNGKLQQEVSDYTILVIPGAATVTAKGTWAADDTVTLLAYGEMLVGP